MFNSINEAKTKYGLMDFLKIRCSTILLCIILIMLPVDAAMGDIIGSVSIINYFILTYYGFRIFDISKEKKIRLYFCSIWVAFFGIYMFSTYIWSDWNNPSLFYALSLLNGLGLFYFNFINSYSEKELYYINRSIMLSFYVVIIFIAMNIMQLGFDNMAQNSRMSLQVGRSFDQNFFVASLSMIVAFLMYDYLKFKNIVSLIKVCLLFAVGLILGSRGGLLCLILVAISEVVMLRKIKLYNFILCGIVLSVLIYFMPENFFERFSYESIIQSRGTGRFDIWYQAISSLLESSLFRVIFGFGLGEFGYVIPHVGMHVAHNSFISILIEGGIVGLLLFITVLFNCFYLAKKNNNIRIIAAMLGMIVACLSLDIYVIRTFWVVLGFSLIDLNQKCG